MSSGQPNGSSLSSGSDPSIATDTTTLEADITQLSSLLSQETNVAELLSCLESADGMARGVESRLDSILGNLDSLLAILEPKGNTSVHNSDTATDQPSANPSNHGPVKNGCDVDS